MDSSNKKFHFGFQHVSAATKTEKVGEVFRRVSSRYDLMNDVMSLGIHRLWKKRFVDNLPLHHRGVYVDVAGGTGDIGAALLQRFKQNDFEAYVIESDINPDMIEVGKKRFPELSWVCGSAEMLPLKDNSVDVYTIVFGLRNVTYPRQALQEAFRVLKPGGKFACLEFSKPVRPLQKLYDFYSFEVIPRMGEWIAQNKEAYQYLSESIRTFLTREEVLLLMKEIGFLYAVCEPWSGGIVALHEGYKPF